MFVDARFKLNSQTKDWLQKSVPNFGYQPLGEVIYNLHYSRRIANRQESWADTCIRVVEGVFSIRKDWYIKNHLDWREVKAQLYADGMVKAMFRMHWLPPGRGLWAMGTDFIYERGAMALYNCAYTNIEAGSWIQDLAWLMDTLMYGVGVGFGPCSSDLTLHYPSSDTYDFVIEDSREGWVDSLTALLTSYASGGARPVFDYSYIRPAGSKIRSFGGIASGPDPLIQLHRVVSGQCHSKLSQPGFSDLRFTTDLANLIGTCVVTGNVRRSAELALAPFSTEFLDLKNYDIYPYRTDWGWMSNNAVKLESDDDFNNLGRIAYRVLKDGDPSYVNMRNLCRGRLGHNDSLILDEAVGLNPCGEIPLENKEVCNVSETLPTRCPTTIHWLRACEYATFYSSTVSLLPTHSQETNLKIAKNRRIGVSIIDFTGWVENEHVHNITSHLRAGYKRIRETNKFLAVAAGIREANRVTTIKPGGTTPKLAGRTAGMSYPTGRYTLRRIRIQKNSPVFKILSDAGIPHEPALENPEYTEVFEFPIIQGPAQPIREISVWKQAFNLILLQREWSDNAVSNTLYFNPITEAKDVEPLLSAIAPHVKSVSMCPQVPTELYDQLPEEDITAEEYDRRVAMISDINWSSFVGDGQDEKFCSGDKCEIK